MAQSRLLASARRFVAVVFGLLALSFIASTGLLLFEFQDTEPLVMLSAHSNLFVYFPTLGLVALAAFYVPAVIFTDLYWRRHVTSGPGRYALGFLVVIGLSYFASEQLNSSPLRPLWEIEPTRLEEDSNARNKCVGNEAENAANPPKALPTCRPTLLGTAIDLHAKAQSRVALSPLARECKSDDLLERPVDYKSPRYCFPAHTWLGTEHCCEMQSRLASRAHELWSTPGYRSTTATLDRFFFLPLKCFFVIVILLIGALLIFRKPRLVAHYSDLLPAMERGLQIGALAMLPWLIMDYAQQQTADVLYGATSGFPFRPSLILVPWALLLAGYFADRIQIELVRMVQLLSGIISAVAILNYRSVFDWSAKLVGVGASPWNFVVLVIVSIAALFYLLAWIPGALRGEDKGNIAPPPSTLSGFDDAPHT